MELWRKHRCKRKRQIVRGKCSQLFETGRKVFGNFEHIIWFIIFWWCKHLYNGKLCNQTKIVMQRADRKTEMVIYFKFSQHFYGTAKLQSNVPIYVDEINGFDDSLAVQNWDNAIIKVFAVVFFWQSFRLEAFVLCIHNFIENKWLRKTKSDSRMEQTILFVSI